MRTPALAIDITNELTPDEVAEKVLELVTLLVEDHKLARTLEGSGPLPELDRVRSYCPPECRYDYAGPEAVAS